MSCCSEVVSIGCVDYCQNIDIDFAAVQTGDHVIEVGVNSYTFNSYTETFTVGEDILINGNEINEARTQNIKIVQPDGTYYDFVDGVECLELTTKINYGGTGTIAPSEECVYEPVYIDVLAMETSTEILAAEWECLGSYPNLNFTNTSTGAQFQMNWNYDVFPNPTKITINWGAGLPFAVSIKMT